MSYDQNYITFYLAFYESLGQEMELSGLKHPDVLSYLFCCE